MEKNQSFIWVCQDDKTIVTYFPLFSRLCLAKTIFLFFYTFPSWNLHIGCCIVILIQTQISANTIRIHKIFIIFINLFSHFSHIIVYFCIRFEMKSSWGEIIRIFYLYKKKQYGSHPLEIFFFSWTGLNLNPFSFYLITDWALYRNGVPWPDVTLLSVHLAGRGRQVKHHKFQLPMRRHIECLSIVHLMVSLGCFRI